MQGVRDSLEPPGEGGTHSTPAGWMRIGRRSRDCGGDSWRAKVRVVPRGVTARALDSAAAVGLKYLGLSVGDVIHAVCPSEGSATIATI